MTKHRNPIGVLLHALCVAGAILMSLLMPAPVLMVAGVWLIAGCTLLPGRVPLAGRLHVEAWIAGAVGVLTIGLMVLGGFASGTFSFLDGYYACVAWLIAGASTATAMRTTVGSAKTLWKVLAAVWMAVGNVVLLVGAHLGNRVAEFHVAIVVSLAWLVLCRAWFRLPALAVLGVNTWILLLVLLPLTDWVVRPGEHFDADPDIAGRDYLYSEFLKDPEAYARYGRKYVAQWDRFEREVYMPDPTGELPYLLRPNSEAAFFQSVIRVNSDGIRGAEIIRPKGGIYRILVLGESTTFGVTLTSDHKPWPEFLADLIRDELRPDRPFQVINAGVPGYTLEDNVHRLKQLLPWLQPDLLISYHGYNGFHYLFSNLRCAGARGIPTRLQRPLWLLAECEYRLKLRAYHRSLMERRNERLPPLSVVLESRYAQIYEELISLAAAHGIPLVIGNFSMAVNDSSPPEVKEFYRDTGFPNVYPAIQANQLHTMLVQELAHGRPEVTLVDTHPHLDGVHEYFTDLVHLSPAGDRQVAAAFFDGLSNRLREDLSELPVSGRAGPTEQPDSE